MNTIVCPFCLTEVLFDKVGTCKKCSFTIVQKEFPPQIAPNDAMIELKQPWNILLDIRTDFEYKNGAVEGALHIVMSDLPKRYMEISRKNSIIVMCATGSRSHDATKFLVQKGYKAKNLTGGLFRLNKEFQEMASQGKP